MKKTILITGSTDGIGKLAAIKLAKDGHTIYLHGRNSEKLEKVISEVKVAADNENIKGFIADFSDLGAVKQMMLQVKEQLAHLDVLINNAGVLKTPTAITKDNLDIRFTVNYFAPYLLTRTLIPLLEKGTASRIINLSSAAQSAVSEAALAGKLSVGINEGYAQSKLALTMWSFELAKLLKNIAVIAVNPGSLLNTKMVIEGYGKFWSSADKGANILYDLAVSSEYDGVTGKYFDNDKGSFGQAHPDAYNQVEINKLLDATDGILMGSK